LRRCTPTQAGFPAIRDGPSAELWPPRLGGMGKVRVTASGGRTGPWPGWAELVRPPIGSVHGDLAGGPVPFDPPCSFVDPHMVVTAQRDQLFDLRLTAEAPGGEVMYVGPGARGVAAGPSATPVPGLQGAADPGRHQVVGAAHIKGEPGGRDLAAEPPATPAAATAAPQPGSTRRRRAGVGRSLLWTQKSS
jgi:hypothetical protein